MLSYLKLSALQHLGNRDMESACINSCSYLKGSETNGSRCLQEEIQHGVFQGQIRKGKMFEGTHRGAR